MSCILSGARVFHGDPVSFCPGELFVEGGKLTAPKQADADVERIDLGGAIVLPGMTIAHHHLYSALARGMPGPSSPPDGFLQVLKKVWWRLDRALDLQLCELSARVGMAEALLCGVTSVIDHHASPCAIEGSLDRIAKGIVVVGGRGALCYETTDRHGAAGFEAGLAENARLLEAGRSSTIAGMVGGHAPFTLGDDQLRMAAELAAAHDAFVHIHVAEALHDQQDARRRGAKHVTERLQSSGILAGRSVLAHGVHLSADEHALIANSSAWLTHQPRSNMNNHVGYLEAVEHQRVALGTDGINGDIWAEAQAGFFRLREYQAAAGAESVWSWLANSWKLLSEVFRLPQGETFGRLDPGCPADLIVLDYDAPTPVTQGNLPWHWIFGMSGRHVRHVMVAGEWAVWDRQLTKVDAASLREETHAGAERLWARMAEIA